ncbi:transcriptional regulator [Staphylococcus kloosii]|jgi:DNA-binding MarR family transcriptional regulator|nr:MarR family transcriptional regulator [Staphylococcus kloosii]AVQ36558.1 MarR family transcriptional regulator [Staphylococcus kloosii]KYH14855.1 transcriptional regulator [Staphylococcus kloosii]MBF7022458.1 MarR family transcriptional regulator [Staphylococcus kloosii]MBF7028959.1 MarR family transcriptional regulator [Staphylococcus kloosii]MCD8878265.1 MarR family transcriptional regulator [Staphylococcus kloosii]
MDYDNDIKREFCFLFYVSNKEVVSRFNQYLKQYDISFPNFIVLQYIEESNPIFIKTLCDELFLDSGTISPIIKRLEKKNLIKRRRTEEDERRVKVILTDEGVELKKHFSQVITDVLLQFNMSDEDLNDYTHILRKFVDININSK